MNVIFCKLRGNAEGNDWLIKCRRIGWNVINTRPYHHLPSGEMWPNAYSKKKVNSSNPKGKLFRSFLYGLVELYEKCFAKYHFILEFCARHVPKH